MTLFKREILNKGKKTRINEQLSKIEMQQIITRQQVIQITREMIKDNMIKT